MPDTPFLVQKRSNFLHGWIWILPVFLLPWLAQSQVVLNEVCADNAGSVLSPVGTSPDYIELYNTGTGAVLLDGWSLTDNLTVPANFMLPVGTTIAARGFLIVWLDNRNNYPGIVTTNFSLKSSGEEIGLFQGSTRRDSIKFGPQIANLPLSRIPNGTGNWGLGQPSPLATNKAVSVSAFGTNTALRLNEWLATNSAGANSDWVELYNPRTNGIVSLGGLVISDMIYSPATPVTTASIIPNSFIDSGGFIRLWCDGSTNKGNHLDIKLSSTLGETLSLYRSNRSNILDRVTFGPQSEDVSMGRLPDGGTNIFLFPGTNNMSPGNANVWQSLPSVVVSEVLTHTAPPLEDAIELQNVSTAPVDISNWYLSNSEEFPMKFRIPAGTVLPPGGYRVFYEQNQLTAASSTPGFDRSGTGNAPDFIFNSAHGDFAVITEALSNGAVTGRRNSRSFGAAANAVSFGRYVKSDGGTDLVPMAARSFGADRPSTVTGFRTGAGLGNAYPQIALLVISEIMYHPPPVINGTVTNDNTLDEFIELTSVTNGVLPLFDPDFPTNTWHLTGGVSFAFPTNQSLPANGRALLVNFNPKTNLTQLSQFRSTYGVDTNVPIFGPCSGALGNHIDTVQIERPDAVQGPPHPDAGFVPYLLVEKVKYEDSNGWPTNANGTGLSLHRLSQTGYANDQTNWFAAGPNPGRGDTVGSRPVIVTPPSSLLVSVGAPADFTVIATGSAPLSYLWRANGTNVPNSSTASLSLPSVQLSQAGDYNVIVTSPFGSVTSAPAILTVGLPPTITVPPLSQFVPAGASVVLTVAATGTPRLNYQWQRSGTNLPAQVADTLSFPNAQTNQSGLYRVAIANSFGAVTGAPVTLSIAGPPWLAMMGIAADGAPLLQLSGVPGHVYDVEAIGDLRLTNWILVSRFTNTLGVHSLLDPSAIPLPQRLYRARLRP